MTPLSPGIRIGEYVLERFLGRGGFGEVWSAEHHELPDRRVAIKVPHSPESVAMLRREGKVLATLDHPGIARVLGMDLAHDPAYCVIELVEGGNLADRLRAEGPLAPDIVRDIIVELLAVLEYAHHRGIVHRDIKPENVLVTRSGELRLTDFGFAHSLTGVSIQLSTSLAPSVASFAGTIAYVAPEVRDGEESIDGRADLYSLGILFFELLTGRRPAGPEVPSELRDGLPEWCDRIFRRLCARRDRRFPTAARAREAIIHVSAPAETSPAPETAGSATPEVGADRTEEQPTPRVILRELPPDLPPPPPFTVIEDLTDAQSLAIEILSGPKVIEVRHAFDIEEYETDGTVDPQELELLGRISESQLSFLRRTLEAPEGSRTFYIQRETVDWLEELGIDDALRRVLRDGLGRDAGFDLLWHDPLEAEIDDDEVFWGPARSA